MNKILIFLLIISVSGISCQGRYEHLNSEELLLKAEQSRQKNERAAINLQIAALKKAEDENVREKAIQALLQAKDPYAAKALTDLLKHQDPRVRKAAVSVLGRLSFDGISEVLVSALSDPDAGVFETALESLRYIQNNPNIMINFFKTKDKGSDYIIRKYPSLALMPSKDPRVFDALLDGLRDQNGKIREKSAMLISMFHARNPGATEPLIDALNDENEKVRIHVISALGKAKDVRSVRPLIRALEAARNNSNLQYHLEGALKDMGDLDEAEAFLDALNSENVRVRAIAARALQDIGDPQTIEPLIRIFCKALLNPLSTYYIVKGERKARINQYGKDVEAMAKALRAIDAKGTVELLITSLQIGDKNTRRGAARALGWINDERAINPLIDALRDEDNEIKISAAGILGNTKDFRVVEPLIAVFEKTGPEHPDLMSQIHSALTKLANSDFGHDPAAWRDWWQRNKDYLIIKNQERG